MNEMIAKRKPSLLRNVDKSSGIGGKRIDKIKKEHFVKFLSNLTQEQSILILVIVLILIVCVIWIFFGYKYVWLPTEKSFESVPSTI